MYMTQRALVLSLVPHLVCIASAIRVTSDEDLKAYKDAEQAELDRLCGPPCREPTEAEKAAAMVNATMAFTDTLKDVQAANGMKAVAVKAAAKLQREIDRPDPVAPEEEPLPPIDLPTQLPTPAPTIAPTHMPTPSPTALPPFRPKKDPDAEDAAKLAEDAAKAAESAIPDPDDGSQGIDAANRAARDAAQDAVSKAEEALDKATEAASAAADAGGAKEVADALKPDDAESELDAENDAAIQALKDDAKKKELEDEAASAGMESKKEADAKAERDLEKKVEQEKDRKDALDKAKERIKEKEDRHKKFKDLEKAHEGKAKKDKDAEEEKEKKDKADVDLQDKAFAAQEKAEQSALSDAGHHAAEEARQHAENEARAVEDAIAKPKNTKEGSGKGDYQNDTKEEKGKEDPDDDPICSGWNPADGPLKGEGATCKEPPDFRERAWCWVEPDNAQASKFMRPSEFYDGKFFAPCTPKS